MRKIVLLTTLLIISITAQSQQIDQDLLDIKKDLDEVVAAKAKAQLELDVSFINMPIKFADLSYQKGKTIKYNSDNFIIIPKRGLDFSWDGLFKYSFMTVDRGFETTNGRTLKALNIIPLDNKADFAIITMKMDTTLHQIAEAEITTKNEGTFQLFFTYEDKVRFPSEIRVEFEMEKIKIPLNFMGKDAEIDKKELKEDGLKTGRIYLKLDWHDIQLAE
jgi:hypothetical protein